MVIKAAYLTARNAATQRAPSTYWSHDKTPALYRIATLHYPDDASLPTAEERGVGKTDPADAYAE